MKKPPSDGMKKAGNTHIAGELFVAAELAKRGHQVSLTMGNAKAVDLFAEHNGRTLAIQVKAIAHKRHSGWPLPFDQSKIIPSVIYVCVILNDIGEMPSYYVLQPETVLALGQWYSNRAILPTGKVRNSQHSGAWHIIDAALGKA